MGNIWENVGKYVNLMLLFGEVVECVGWCWFIIDVDGLISGLDVGVW